MRILALLCAFLLISAPTAHAGGFAVTYLDPVPSIQPGVTHTVGYWVLQHGTHPFVGGDLGKTGLTFRGKTVGEQAFVGVPLGEPAHYAVTFTLPPGTFEVYAMQGMFQEHHVGTLTVPGTLLVKPVDHIGYTPEGPSPWGAIAPPIKLPASTPTMSPAPAAVVQEEPADEPAPVWLVGLVVVGAAGLFVLLRKRLRPAARR